MMTHTSPDTDDSNTRIRKQRFLSVMEDTVSWMADAVVDTLGSVVADFPTESCHADFKRCCRRVLEHAASCEQKVLFLQEAIPGFTIMLLKKEGWDDMVKEVKATPRTVRKHIGKAQDSAIADLVNTYVERTGNRVLSIEGQDVRIVLFPVDDLKDNLRAMGIWS